MPTTKASKPPSRRRGQSKPWVSASPLMRSRSRVMRGMKSVVSSVPVRAVVS